jgi:hypothetical protein
MTGNYYFILFYSLSFFFSFLLFPLYSPATPFCPRRTFVSLSRAYLSYLFQPAAPTAPNAPGPAPDLETPNHVLDYQPPFIYVPKPVPFPARPYWIHSSPVSFQVFARFI